MSCYENTKIQLSLVGFFKLTSNQFSFLPRRQWNLSLQFLTWRTLLLRFHVVQVKFLTAGKGGCRRTNRWFSLTNGSFKIPCTCFDMITWYFSKWRRRRRYLASSINDFYQIIRLDLMEIKVTLDKGNADVILLIRDNVLEAFDSRRKVSRCCHQMKSIISQVIDFLPGLLDDFSVKMSALFIFFLWNEIKSAKVELLF